MLGVEIPFDKIMDYEFGALSEEDMISLFQHLVDTGLVWRMQGHYGRVAMSLIEAGVVSPPDGSEA